MSDHDIDKPPKGMSNDYTLDHLAGQIVGMRSDISRLYKLMEGRLDDHEKRIVRLEHYRWWLIGIAAGIAFIIPIAYEVLTP